MGQGKQSPLTAARSLVVVAVVVAFWWLALPGAALANHSTAPGWFWLNPLPTGDRSYYDVSMVGDEAWLAVGAPYLLHSTDAGRTWQPLLTTDGSGYFRLVDFVSTAVGYACRDNSGIYRTTNGGSTWTLVQALNAGSIDDLCALDATHAWVQVGPGGDAGQYRTTNGTTWTKTTPPDSLADVVFTDASNGWAVANAYAYDSGTGKYTASSTIYKTTDGGGAWNPWRTTLNEELLCVAAPSANRVVFGGDAIQPFYDDDNPKGQTPRVVVMTASGTSFANVTLPGTDCDVMELVFSDASRGWAALSDQSMAAADTSAIATTANGGDSWSVVQQPGMGQLDSNPSGTVLAAGRRSCALAEGLPTMLWTKDVLRATAGGSFESTDYGTLDRSLAVGDLAFADGDHGWSLYSQSVARTQNGGASWQTVRVIPEHTAPELRAITAASAEKIWAVGVGGTMFTSADGGATWGAVDPATSNTLVDVAFGSVSVGWAVGGASLQRTTNGGTSWFPVSPDARYSWDGVAAPSESLACFTGRDGTAARDCIVRTANGGSSFDAVQIAATGVDLKGVWFRDEREGWAYGNRGTLYRTADGGATWSPVSFGDVFHGSDLSSVTVTDVVFETATKGWAFCSLSLGGPVQTWYLLGTTDGGVTWSDLTDATGLDYTDELYAAASAGGKTWFGGKNGTLLADVNADTLPPVTTSSYDGKWTNQPVSVTLSAVDAGAGVAYTKYRYKTAPWAYGTTVPTVAAPTDHTNDGAWRLLYQSVDVFGQAEALKTQFVKIDTRVPQGANVASSPAIVPSKYLGPDFTLRWSGLDWATPVVVAAQTSVNAVDVVGDIAYVLDGGLLRVVDVSKPMSPSQIGSAELPGTPTDVRVVGEFAYVAAGDEGLVVVYVGDSAQPEVAGVARFDGVAAQVAVTNSLAYVTTTAGRVAMVDVRDPGSPGQLDLIDARGVVDVVAEGDLLCLVGDGYAATFNVERPDRPAQIGAVELKATPQAVALSGATACVAAGTTQYVLALNGAGRPELAGSYTSAYDCSDVAVNGELAHFVCTAGYLAVDVSAPDWPVFAGGRSLPTMPGVALDAAGEYAYIADGAGGMQLMRAMPIEAASYVLDIDGQLTGPDNVPEPDAHTVSYTDVADGAKQFRVQTRDQAGNWNAFVNFAFTVDATAPQMVAGTDDAWHRGFVLPVTASDTGAGLATVEYRVDEGSWMAGGAAFSVELRTWKRGANSGVHTVEGRATDRVGNTASAGPWVVKLDSRVPVTTDDAPKNPTDPWNPPPSAVPVTVRLNASDAHSGVAATWYRLDGGDWSQGTEVTVAAPANGSNDGRHWIGYYSVDAAGNTENAHWIPVVIDVPGAGAAKMRVGTIRLGSRELLLGADIVKAARVRTTSRQVSCISRAST